MAGDYQWFHDAAMGAFVTSLGLRIDQELDKNNFLQK